MLVPISNVGQIGVISDIPNHRLPANAWSDAKNVRFFDNSVWKAKGQEAVLGTPTVDPYYIYSTYGSAGQLWAYPGLAKIYATDGSTHSNLTRAVGGDYTGGADDIWQGTHLGGIDIFNNGKDTPQAWIAPALATPCVDLANWPASTTAKVIKSFRQYLVALDVTKSGTQYRSLVKWSDVATPGSVPGSWDETDATKDAGEYALSDSGTSCVDAFRLGDVLLVYKENETWAMAYTGGRFVFNFKKRFNTGVVSPRCIVNWKTRHFVALPDDIIVHDGFQQESILDDKMRRWYEGRTDTSIQYRQYMAYNRLENELWMCMPEFGEDHPTVALVYNMKDGTCSVRDLDSPTYITTAFFDNSGGTTFQDVGIPFDQMQGQFDVEQSQPGPSRMIGAHRVTSKRFLLYDEGFDDEGSNFRGYVTRESMPISGIDRFGNPVMDAGSIKQVNEIWPEIRIQNGTTVDIYVGGQDTLNDPITWEGPLTFTVGVDDKVDCCTTGRYLSFRFETTDKSQWKLDSYTLNLEVLGRY